MSLSVDVISQGRLQTVAGAELDELRASDVSWVAYGQQRLALSHAEAVASLTRFTHAATPAAQAA